MTIEQAKTIIELLKPNMVNCDSLTIEVRNYGEPEVVAHGFTTYEHSTEFMRALGVGERTKDVYPEGRCVLQGKSEGVTVRAFVDSLPPTCRIEKWTEKIPISKTVTTDEFVEVERTKVVCGGEA